MSVLRITSTIEVHVDCDMTAYANKCAENLLPGHVAVIIDPHRIGIGHFTDCTTDAEQLAANEVAFRSLLPGLPSEFEADEAEFRRAIGGDAA